MNASKTDTTFRLLADATARRDVPADEYARAVAGLFGLGQRCDEVLFDHFELTIRPGQITAIVGPSGAGKSVLLELAGQKLPGALTLPIDRLSRSARPAVAILEGTLRERLDVLSRCGLAEAAVMVTSARHLSGGQRYRLALAWALQKALRRGRTTAVLADEFASCLDRVTAENLCRQLRKLVTRSKLSLVLATPRTELLDALEPDQIVVKPLGEGPRLIVPPSAEPSEIDLPGTQGCRIVGCRGRGVCDHAGRRGCKQRSHGTQADWSIERGTIRDYRALARFHYVAGPPAAHKRVYVIRPPQAQRGLATPEVAAVLVVSPPVPHVRGRNLATDGRYLPRRADEGDPADGRRFLDLLNAEMECISRVIVHPMYRGLGLAVRLVRHALADSPTPLMEALAVMGRVHPFFAWAGMTPMGLMPGTRVPYCYYIAHTGQCRPIVEWLWDKEKIGK